MLHFFLIRKNTYVGNVIVPIVELPVGIRCVCVGSNIITLKKEAQPQKKIGDGIQYIGASTQTRVFFVDLCFIYLFIYFNANVLLYPRLNMIFVQYNIHIVVRTRCRCAQSPCIYTYTHIVCPCQRGWPFVPY